jgi:hypothetical protein
MPEDMAEAERHARVLANSAKEKLDPSSRDRDGYARRPISHMLPLTYPKGQGGCQEIFSD